MSRSTVPTRASARRLLAAVAALAIGLFAAVIPAGAASADGIASGRLVTQVSTAMLPDPILGLAVEIWTGGTLIETLESDPITGEFAVTDPLPDGGYYYWVRDGSQDDAGHTYDQANQSFYVTGGDIDLGDIVVARYMPVSGTITNWSGDIRVQLYQDNGGSWSQEASAHFTGGTFAVYAPIYADDYTLLFILEDEAAPFADAYLGGTYEPDDVLTTRLTATPGVGFSGISMTLPDAAIITGRVTDSSGPLAGVEVWAEDDPDFVEYAVDTTDSNGEYTLYVRPGLTYAVGTYGDPTHAGLVFDGFECECSGFTPVTPTVADPEVDIDLELTSDIPIAGIVLDDDMGDIVAGLDVKLYKLSVGGVWVLHDEIESIYDFPAFEFQITSTGEYRLQFVDSSGKILMVVGGATEDFYGDGELLDPISACYAELNERSEYTFVYAVVDLDTAASACAALVAAIPPTTPGTGGVKKPRGTSVVVATTATPSPTPSATPTGSPTPRPSADPTPSSTPVATDEPPASAPDFWWLLWVGIGILLIVIVGGVVYFVRRT